MLLTRDDLKALEDIEVDFWENGDIFQFEPTLGDTWDSLYEMMQDYLARYGSEKFKNGYLHGYKSALKSLGMLEKICEELAGNKKVLKVPLLSGGNLIMYCMELFGFKINEEGKYERR